MWTGCPIFTSFDSKFCFLLPLRRDFYGLFWPEEKALFFFSVHNTYSSWHSQVCDTPGKNNLSAEGIIPKQGDDEDLSDIHMVLLILRAEQETKYPCMGALVHNLAVLDDSERHHIVGHDGIHDAEVALLGAIKVSNEVADFGVQVAGSISMDIFGIGIVDAILLQVVQ